MPIHGHMPFHMTKISVSNDGGLGEITASSNLQKIMGATYNMKFESNRNVHKGTFFLLSDIAPLRKSWSDAVIFNQCRSRNEKHLTYHKLECTKVKATWWAVASTKSLDHVLNSTCECWHAKAKSSKFGKAAAKRSADEVDKVAKGEGAKKKKKVM